MNLYIKKIEYHRNGISGAPFYVILFSDAAEGEMLAVVFESEYHVAVLNVDKLKADNIRFGSNSWRGDRYEPFLRNAIQHHNQNHNPN